MQQSDEFDLLDKEWQIRMQNAREFAQFSPPEYRQWIFYIFKQ